jgi:hypothetical protein
MKYQIVALDKRDFILKYEHVEENEVSKLIKFMNFWAVQEDCSTIKITKWVEGVRQ